VQVTKFLQWFVIHVQGESFALEILVKEVHTPHGGSSLEQEGLVVYFVVLKLSGCE
jgi:hypothetical protein